jgi:hypothetical protein
MRRKPKLCNNVGNAPFIGGQAVQSISQGNEGVKQ